MTLGEAIAAVHHDVAMTHAAGCVCRACWATIRDDAWIVAWWAVIELYDRGSGDYRAYLHDHLGGHAARIVAVWYRPTGVWSDAFAPLEARDD